MSSAHGGFGPSDEQQAVLDRAGRPTVLVAAAGSGKTSVLTWLYSQAHVDHQLPIGELLAITFTNRAAGELRTRIASELRGRSLDGRDPDLSEAWIGTFHGICSRLLREFAHHRGIDPGFAIIEELDARELQALAWEDAVRSLLTDHGPAAAELVAQLGELQLRDAAVGWWTARRSAGQIHPRLPLPDASAGGAHLAAARAAFAVASGGLEDAIAEARSDDRKGVRLDAAEEILAASQLAADELIGLATAEPLDERAIAQGIAALERGKPHKGAPIPNAAEVIDAFLAARDLVARRAAELVAAPKVRLLGELIERFSMSYFDQKRDKESLDHDDLELEALELLRNNPQVRERVTSRFSRILVDEFQDTNERQAELVALIAGGDDWLQREQAAPGAPAVTIVGDPRQAIYGFRNASVALIEHAAATAPPGALLPIATNRRSDGEVLGAIDAAWAQLVDAHEPVVAGRGREPLAGDEPRVELLITKNDTEDPWDPVALGGQASDRAVQLAEARLAAHRIAQLREREPHASVAVLSRTRRALGPIAGALADLGIDAVLDGAEGFWERPEVADLVAWLRLVRNPHDDAALIAVLASPLVGLSADGLAIAGSLRPRRADRGDDAADAAGGSRWALLQAAVDGDLLPSDDARRLRDLGALIGKQRQPGRATDPAALIDEVLIATAYDEHLQRLTDPARRLANVGRLRRLAAREAAQGGDLTSLLDRAASEQRHGLRTPEAALGGDGAVQLMTVHQAKGLEFDTVVVAGLGGKTANTTAPLLGDHERLGLRWREAPKAPLRSLYDHTELVEERKAREQAETLRVMYVALTRARDRLIVSGIADWKEGDHKLTAEGPGQGTAVAWLAPALVPDLDVLVAAAELAPTRSALGLLVSVSAPGGDVLPPHARAPRVEELVPHRPAGPSASAASAAAVRPPAPPAALSYTSLTAHRTCGLRFQATQILGLPPTDPLPVRSGAGDSSSSIAAPAVSVLRGAELGNVVHAVLEHASAAPPSEELLAAAAREIAAQGVASDAAGLARAAELAEAATSSPLWQELWAHGAPRRELPFTVAVGEAGHILTGVVDAQVQLAGGEVLVVDYKTDRVPEGADLAQHVEQHYRLQRAAYALAALQAGAPAVRVVHLFLSAPGAPAVEFRAAPADVPLLAEPLAEPLAEACARIASGESRATATPDAWICDGCPARGRLCGWPVELTQRAPQQGPADAAHWQGDPERVRGV